jgi:hypothetical protein
MVNSQLVTTLTDLLKRAEEGTITDGAFITQGKKTYRHFFSVLNPDDLPRMLGEITLMLASMEYMIIKGRAARDMEDPKVEMQGGAVALKASRGR